MKTRTIKTLSVCAMLLFCAVSIAYSEECIQCNIDPTSYDWLEGQTATWQSGVYALKINCVDTCNNNAPAVNHVAEYTATLNLTSGPPYNNPVAYITLSSTPTDSNGDAYVTVSLIHDPIDGGSLIHLCPFDDVNCSGGSSSPSLASPLASRISPLYDSGSGPGCYGRTGCCEITVTVKCCTPWKTYTFCTTSTEYLCNFLNFSNSCLTVATKWAPGGTCNYCTGMCDISTVISLTSFTAQASNGRVKLEWTTEAEIDNAGFNIYRSETEAGEYVKINSELIPAKGSETKGAKYVFTDNIAKNRKTYFYKLEDVDLNGTSTMHGPKSATPRLILGILGK
jgi:hypothetical protein